jgi:aldose 1-epimerase
MKRITLLGMFIATIFAFLITSCNNTTTNKMEKSKGITSSSFGTADGKEVFLYTLINSKGTQITITNFGGIVTSWVSADRNNIKSSIVLGYDSLSGYLATHPYFGAIVGRYGNRIAKGKFSIDSVAYTLAINNVPNHLHGGLKGFDKSVWEPTVENDSVPSLMLSYLSKDGEEGYPGNLKVDVHYTLTDEDELKIEYNATTDKKTVINLTNHSYFNLTGDVTNNILDHELQIDADHITSVDSTLIPTGDITPVKGTPYDFTQPAKIGLRIDSVKGGYDHNYVFNKTDASLTKVITVSEEKSGRVLEVFTTEPGVQFYTGNFLDGKLKTSEGKSIGQHAALCLETQHFPNSPNEPSFPTTILLPGQKYHTVTVYKLSVNK